MPGRPKEFNREEVLSEAMEVFWAKGYQGASIGDLERYTGLGRQSIYNEFGDKEGIFLAAIKHYEQTYTQVFIDTVTADGSPQRNIRRWLEALVALGTRPDRKGCMVTNAAMSVAIEDETLHDAAAAALLRLEKALESAVSEAIKRGELPSSTDKKATASYLLSAGQGILVLGRLGHSSASLKRVIDASMHLFRS